MNYAYPEGTHGHLLLEATVVDDEIRFVLRDSGRPFDPTLVPDVDVDSYVAKRSAGGLGIHLVRHYMDSVSYERTDAHNVLTMIKKLKNTTDKDGSNNQEG
jgi:sigma-B regulation protein RsbU (phosphoserine phosphatase)